jgi:DNA polymerase
LDAKEQLRRYLEQRREMGEKELVLDGMSVEDALALLGANAGRRQSATVVRTHVVRSETVRTEPAPAEPRAGDSAHIDVVEQPRPQLVEREISESQIGDWRAALGGKPGDTSRASSAPKPEPVVPHASLPELHTLAEIAAHVATCTRCPLYATALHPVPGEGNPDADFMCVGEAPGATEDETGRPFVGAAGQLLTKILAAIGLTREDVFIANVLKHRPPGNRNPLPNEVAACSPYLIRQIEIVKPKVILALGTFAAQTLLDTKTPLGKLRGEVHRYHGVPLIVTYHPAALLRNPSWKRPTWEDVQLAHRILTGASAPNADA